VNPWRYIAEKSGEEIVEKSSDGAALAEEKNWWSHHYSVKNHFVLFRSNYDSQPRADVAGETTLRL